MVMKSTPPRSRSLFTYVVGATTIVAAGFAVHDLYSPRPYLLGYGYKQGLAFGTLFFHTSNVLRRIVDPERAHRWGITMASQPPKVRMRLGMTEGGKCSDPSELRTTVWGMEFSNPVGMAAGFDKNGEAIDGIRDFGFGFVEIGSVTPLPQPGNPQPRVFRLEDDAAVINRYGFNSVGMDKVKENMEKRLKTKHGEGGERALLPSSREGRNVIVGVNLGRNKTSTSPSDDYCRGILTLGRYAKYVVVNVSSPNTPGLRDLQLKGRLRDLLSKCQRSRDDLVKQGSPRVPIVVKISPDLADGEKVDIASVVKSLRIDGIIVSNTTVSRPPSLQSSPELVAQTGGLSGRPLKDMSTKMVGDMYQLTGGKIPIIGVGGIENGRDAYDKIRAGASLVQLYTSFSYEGPCVVSKVKRELVECLKQDNFPSVQHAIGADFLHPKNDR